MRIPITQKMLMDWAGPNMFRGGQFLFGEHGRAPDLKVRVWQDRLTPLWRPLAGGCHLNRDIPALLKAGGFRLREVHSRYLQGPRPLTWVWHGWAD